MKFKMRGGNILLEPIIEAHPMGLTIAEPRGFIQRKCKIVSVGPGKTNHDGVVQPHGLKVGQVVLIARDAKRDVEDSENKKEYYIADEAEIRAVIE